MQTCNQNGVSVFGNQLVDDISLPKQSLNLLFSALLLSAVGVFLGANLLLLDPATLARSVEIALPCIGLLLIFYSLSWHLGSVIWGLMLTYGLVWLLVYSQIHALAPTIYLLAMIAMFVAIRSLRVERKQWSSIILMAVIATVTILALAMDYTSFDMLPRLHAGNVHQDTLYHASIAAMIKNYGVASTGLNGLVATPYHTFSHALIAGISLISGLGVIEVYGVANSVLFAPILIFSITVFCGKLDRMRQLPLSLVWASACLFLIAMPFLFRRGVIASSYFVSESYLVALSLFMLGLALLFKQRLSFLDLIAAAIFAGMMANAKASVGLLYAGLWFARLIFLLSNQTLRVLAAGFSTALATGLVVFDSAHAVAGSGTLPVDPLHFIRTYAPLGTHLDTAVKSILLGTQPLGLTLILALAALGSFLVLHFILSWVVIGRVYYVNGVIGVFRSPLAFYSLAAVLAGLFIVSIFRIDGGSAYYFSNIAFFVSLPGVIVVAVSWLARRGFDHLRIMFIGIFLTCLLGLKGFCQVSALADDRPGHLANELINQLLQMQTSTSKQIVWLTSQEMQFYNPVKLCTAQPFVYPAVSERPWTDVVADGLKAPCDYYNFGYGQYGITATNKQVNMPPRLLPGMSIQMIQE